LISADELEHCIGSGRLRQRKFNHGHPDARSRFEVPLVILRTDHPRIVNVEKGFNGQCRAYVLSPFGHPYFILRVECE